MTEVFAGGVEVHYGFIDLYSDPDGSGDEADDLVGARRGQANGLVGAQVPHQLGMVTGLHTGEVPLVVTWSEAEPELDDSWEDVVEVSVDLTTRRPHPRHLRERLRVHDPSHRLAPRALLRRRDGRGSGARHPRRR